MFMFTRLFIIIARDTFIKLAILICYVKRDERREIISEHKTMIINSNE